MKVPLFDMTRQYENIKAEVMESLDDIFKSGKVILGTNVKSLEKEIANYTGVSYGIGVANGSDALLIALLGMGIGEGDFVITTPYTFFATVSCITRNGATPIFADIDPVTFNIDLNHVEEILQSHPMKERIKAIIPVHIFGQTVDLEKLEKLRDKYGIKILEDCAQSIGSSWKYKDNTLKNCGTIGEAGTISFFPTKNLGGYGDGGMIVTKDEKLAEYCRTCRVHGSKVKYVHEFVGINSRLDEIQAAILRIKLRKLDEYIEKRKYIAGEYARLFSSSGVLSGRIVWPDVPEDKGHVFHQYVVRIIGASRDGLKEYLRENEIGTSIYYPKGLHQQQCFEYLGVKEGSLPVTEKACEETIALPIFPEMKSTEIEYIVEKIEEFIEEVDS